MLGRGLVCLQSWAGVSRHPVTIMRETPKRFVVRWDGPSGLGRVTGTEYRVPKGSVVILSRVA